MSDIEKVIKEINKITIEPDEFLAIKVGSDASLEFMQHIADGFDKFMAGKLFGKVLVFHGDVEFHAIKLRGISSEAEV